MLYIGTELARNGNRERFQKILLVHFIKCKEAKFQNYEYERRQSNLQMYFQEYPIKY